MLKYDEIGYWTEIKLEIIKRYATEYSKIITKNPFQVHEHVYIDAFAGPGVHISRATGEYIPGSPLNALSVTPPFKKFYLIDVNAEKTHELKQLILDRRDVEIFTGDCNQVLLQDVFPTVKWSEYKRGLCILDPYNINLNWDVMFQAGQMKSLEIFLNFMVMDMNQNVLKHNFDSVDPTQILRMNNFWGDESWKDAVYQKDLFGEPDKVIDANEKLAKAFQERLKEKAGFKYVPDPLPMRNSNGATIYYLYFASHKPAASGIVEYIFNQYRKRGIV